VHAEEGKNCPTQLGAPGRKKTGEGEIFSVRQPHDSVKKKVLKRNYHWKN